jgi:hypothetical protein
MELSDHYPATNPTLDSLWFVTNKVGFSLLFCMDTYIHEWKPFFDFSGFHADDS